MHGIPGPRRLREGELVKLDVAAELDGFYADACMSVGVGRAEPTTNRLAAAARHALAQAKAVARAGAPQRVIGAAIEREIGARGYAVCGELMGHGIGRRLHESPDVPSVHVPGLPGTLTDGLVLTIEPIVSTGSGEVRLGGDGWTMRTADGALSAHEEHTDRHHARRAAGARPPDHEGGPAGAGPPARCRVSREAARPLR